VTLLSHHAAQWQYPGDGGRDVATGRGSSVNASAVQKPNYAAWFKLESRADEASAEIQRRAESAASSSA
jgi:hypothetical protein